MTLDNFGIVALMIPFVVTTVFDLRSRQIVGHVEAAWGLYKRRCSYAFTEVASVGVTELSNDSVDYMLVTVINDGGIIRLGWDNGSDGSRCANAIRAICVATGLHKLVLPRRR